MKAYFKNHPDEIGKIVIHLADNFAKSLYYFADAKSYSEYIENLKEILKCLEDVNGDCRQEYFSEAFHIKKKKTTDT